EHDDTKSDEVDAVARLEPVAVRTTGEPAAAEARAAAHNPEGLRRCFEVLPAIPPHVGILLVDAPRPLPHVAAHLLASAGAGSPWETADSTDASDSALGDVR